MSVNRECQVYDAVTLPLSKIYGIVKISLYISTEFTRNLQNNTEYIIILHIKLYNTTDLRLLQYSIDLHRMF